MNLVEVVASGTGRRGAGLGNEVIAWGKAQVAAEALGIRLRAPRWLLNAYGLGAQLGIGRPAMLRSEIVSRVLSSISISEGSYRETGRVDFGEAAVAIRDAGGFDGAKVLISEGMWGGYAAIAGSRTFLRDRILAVPGAVELSASATGGAHPTIGLHVRRGDFGAALPEPGTFNRPVPTGWFVAIVRELHQRLPNASFVVCTDAPDGALPELAGLPGVHMVRGQGPAASVQELAVLASCDLLVCSVSSFSMLAAFISDRPYLWYGPQLTVVEGCLTIWGREPAQQATDSPTQRAVALRDESVPARGRPVGTGGRVPVDLGSLATPAGGWDRRRDLLYYGAVPGLAADSEGGGGT